MYISTPPSPEVENFQIKIYHPAGDWTPDLLNQRQTCYHLSQRGELGMWKVCLSKIWNWTWDLLLNCQKLTTFDFEIFTSSCTVDWVCFNCFFTSIFLFLHISLILSCRPQWSSGYHTRLWNRGSRVWCARPRATLTFQLYNTCLKSRLGEINLVVTSRPQQWPGQVQRAQLTKSTLLTSMLVPLASFQIFKGLFRC